MKENATPEHHNIQLSLIQCFFEQMLTCVEMFFFLCERGGPVEGSYKFIKYLEWGLLLVELLRGSASVGQSTLTHFYRLYTLLYCLLLLYLC